MNEITDIVMKQKTIKTDKATLLAVELPEGAYYPNICQLPPSIGVNYFLYENGVNTPYKESLGIPKGNWQLIGRLPDITEEQSSKVVPTMPIQKGKTKRYITAKEAVHFLLQANEVYFENPIPPFIERLEDFKEAQSKVWDKECTFLFIKVD